MNITRPPTSPLNSYNDLKSSQLGAQKNRLGNHTQSNSLSASTSESYKNIGEKQIDHSKVRVGGEVVNLNDIEAISHDTYKTLMNEEPDKPFFALARVKSSSGGQQYKHLYSAENVVNWYPLHGKTDPNTRGEIDRIEYFLHIKGEQDAIHMGDVHPNQTDPGSQYVGDVQTSQSNPVSQTADYLIWSLTAEDEPSKMMALLATAYLQKLGLDNITSDDTFDTSSVSNLAPKNVRDLQQKRTDSANANKIFNYVATHISDLVKQGELKCSDPNALLMSIQHDAALHLADILVSQDPDVDENSDDFAKLPHIRTNSLAMAILKELNFDQTGADNEVAPSITRGNMSRSSFMDNLSITTNRSF